MRTKLSYGKTIETLVEFYKDSFKFWEREDGSKSVAFKKALNDVMDIEHDPFTPNGKELDRKAKKDFVGIVFNVGLYRE